MACFLLTSRIFVTLYLFSTHIFASNILRLPTTNHANFILKEVDKKHATTPYKTITTKTTFDCIDTCTFETSCKSINVDENSDPHECQLVADDRNTVDSYVSAPGLMHFDTGKTTLTTFRNAYHASCIVPRSLSCDASADIELMFTTQMDRCDQLYAYFSFDLDTGRLIHHCTGLTVCAKALAVSSAMILSATCSNVDKEENILHAFSRNYSKLV
jgi:PAN domain.